MTSSCLYPKRESNNANSAIKYFYCAEKSTKNNARREVVPYTHGTILDAKKEVMRKPSFFVTHNRLSGESFKTFAMSDCTVVNLYNVDGVWRMGTRNSWDISEIEEYPGLTNKVLFNEVIDKLGLSFSVSTLDKNKIHTVAFSNPKCHLFAKNYALWSYDPENEFVNQPEPYTGGNNFVVLNPATGELGVQQSPIWKDLTRIMYTDRIRIIESELNYDLAVVKLLIKAAFNKTYSYAQTCEFLDAELNENSKRLFDVIKRCIADINDHFANQIRSFRGVRVPSTYIVGVDGFNGLQNEEIFDKELRTFVLNVIAAELNK